MAEDMGLSSSPLVLSLLFWMIFHGILLARRHPSSDVADCLTAYTVENVFLFRKEFGKSIMKTMCFLSLVLVFRG